MGRSAYGMGRSVREFWAEVRRVGPKCPKILGRSAYAWAEVSANRSKSLSRLWSGNFGQQLPKRPGADLFLRESFVCFGSIVNIGLGLQIWRHKHQLYSIYSYQYKLIDVRQGQPDLGNHYASSMKNK